MVLVILEDLVDPVRPVWMGCLLRPVLLVPPLPVDPILVLVVGVDPGVCMAMLVGVRLLEWVVRSAVTSLAPCTAEIL